MGHNIDKQIIVINGFSCTGKTTLAREISRKIQVPYFSSDEIKDIIMDSIGEVDTSIFNKFNPLSYELMYFAADQILANGQSIILESSYHNNQYNIDKIQYLAEKNKAIIKQIFLYTDNVETIWNRMQERKKHIHSGHADISMTFEMLREKMGMDKYKPITLKGRVLKLQVSNHTELDWNEINNFIAEQSS